jgi:hypothetical protein
MVILLAVVLCEALVMAFIFGIARFYEQKFGETTHELLFLVPIAAFIVGLAASYVAGQGVEWAALLTNACTLLILMTAGLVLYNKMMGVSR